MEAEIVGMADEGGRVRVLLGTEPRLAVEVTPNAVDALALAPGRRVWGSFKATEIEVYCR